MAAGALLLGRVVAAVYVDYQWYAALDATSLWRTRALMSAALLGTTGVVSAAFFFLNFYVVTQSVVSIRLPRQVANLEIGVEVPRQLLVGAAVGLSALLAALLTARQDPWTRLALALSDVKFGDRDPYLQYDLGFYVYVLPLLRTMFVTALAMVLLAAVASIFLYALTPSLEWRQGSLYVSHFVRRHLYALGFLLLLLLAWSYWLDAYEVLLQGSGPDGAVTYSDVTASIPIDQGLSVLTAGVAAIVLWAGWSGQERIALGSAFLLLLTAIASRQLGPVLARRFAEEDSPSRREAPYLGTRLSFTRRAFGTDGVTLAPPGLGFETAPQAAAGVAVWDAPAIARGIERRGAGGAPAVGWQAGPQIVAVATRRSGSAAERPGEPEWSVQRFVGSAADARGEPARRGGDSSAAEEDDLVPPVLVAPGAEGYALVADSAARVAAPGLGSVGARLAHAWHRRDFRLLLGDLPRPRPRLVSHRDVRDRVRRLAPFFEQGTLVAPVVESDTLWWMIDLYSASTTYPLSRRLPFAASEVSYLRHAAAALVNAHTGRVVLVADSDADPIAQTWARSLPGLFVSQLAVRGALLDALPPAVDEARTRGAAFARAGTRARPTPGWHLPALTGADSVAASAEPSLLALPPMGAGQPAVLALTLPLLDARQQLAALVVATGGRSRAVMWRPVAAELNWTTALDQLRRAGEAPAATPRDVRPARGAVRVAPLGTGVIAVQPVYSWRADEPPTLLRIAALTAGVGDDRPAGAARTLGEALGIPAVPADSAPPATPAAFEARVRALYEEMRAALARGDWLAFGRAYDALGAVLGRPR